VVEGTGLENRHTVYAVSRVRISPCPFDRFNRAPQVFAEPKVARCSGVALHPGWVAEWFKAHAWKACLRQKRNEGSNPSPSVDPTWRYALGGIAI
jgi:hypothetical protein